MKRTHRWMTACLLGLGMLLSGCAETSEKTDKKELLIGTSADYEPYEFVDEQGKMVGFDIDIIEAIAKGKGYDIEMVDIPFDELLPSLKKGEVDVVIAAMTPTEERRQSFAFSDSYYSAKDYLVYREGSYTTLLDLKGKKIGVLAGSAQEEYLLGLEENIGYTVVSQGDMSRVYRQLEKGQVDAVLAEDRVVQQHIAQKGWSWMEIGAGKSTTYAIAFPENSPYLDDFNDSIARLKLDGTLDAIILEWMTQ